MNFEAVLVGVAACGLFVASFELKEPGFAVLAAAILLLSLVIFGGRRQ